jgi:hypothetical protein
VSSIQIVHFFTAALVPRYKCIYTDRYTEDRSYGKPDTFCHKTHDDRNETKEEESMTFSWQSIQEVNQRKKDHAQDNLQYRVRGVRTVMPYMKVLEIIYCILYCILEQIILMRFECLTAVIIEIIMSWDVLPCS